MDPRKNVHAFFKNVIWAICTYSPETGYGLYDQTLNPTKKPPKTCEFNHQPIFATLGEGRGNEAALGARKKEQIKLKKKNLTEGKDAKKAETSQENRYRDKKIHIYD